MLFVKVGNGKLYLRKIDSVEYLHKSDFDGEYWPFLSDDVAYYHDEKGYNTTDISRIVEADETEVVRVLGKSLYKWKE